MKYVVLALTSLCLGCGAIAGPSYTPDPKNEFLSEVSVAACSSQRSAPKASLTLPPIRYFDLGQSSEAATNKGFILENLSEDSPWYGSSWFDPNLRPLTFSEFSQRYGCAAAHRVFGSIEPGSTEQLAAITYPTGHADDLGRRLQGSEVTWRSLDTSIATVDSDGLVTAVKPGKVLISVKGNICLLPTGVGIGFGLAEHLGPAP
jgi:Bacterial Ig-like domain (group 2)